MGLFKKNQQTEVELEAMRAEMRSLREHLEQTDAVKDRLAERLGRLDAENERLTHHVGKVEARVGEVATQVGSVEHEVVRVEGLQSETGGLGELARVPDDGALDATIADLRNHLDELTAAFDLQQAQIADVTLVTVDTAEQTHALAAERATPGEAGPDDAGRPVGDDETKRQIGQLAEKVSALDSRVNQVSLELTNQLTELSSDLDRVGDRADTIELIDRINGQLDELTTGQERLAGEQARYAIQFRSDLADLADRLRRD